MKILLVGIDRKILDHRKELFQEVFPEDEYAVFLDPLMAVKHCLNWKANLAVSEFGLPMIDGIKFLKLLRNQNPEILPLLVEKQELHRRDAGNLGFGYLLEPINDINILDAYEQVMRSSEE